jgi:hypothetical protein
MNLTQQIKEQESLIIQTKALQKKNNRKYGK